MSEITPRSETSSGVSGIARHGRLKKPGTLGGILGLIGVVVAVIVVSSLVLSGIVVYQAAKALGPGVNIHPNESVAPPPGIGVYPGGFNILIVGDDTRAGQDGIGVGAGDGGALNDVTILLHVSADHTFATAVSFPRDMIVPHPQCAKGGVATGLPINNALSYGGLACVVTTVENFTGLSIQFAGLITFTGVIDMSDAVGGVNVCTTGPMIDNYSGINLPTAGNHLLEGAQALAFLRARHGIGDGSDLGRISSQQVYLSSLVRTMEASGTLGNPVTVYKIATAAVQNMQLSTSLQSIPTLLSIAQTLKNIPPSRVQFVQYPGTTGGTGIFTGKVQPNLTLGNQLIGLIKADKPFTLGVEGDDRGSVIEASPPTGSTPAPTSGSSSAPITGSSTAPTKGSSAAAPTTSPSTSGPTTVINGLVGQSAAQQSCAKTRPLIDQ